MESSFYLVHLGVLAGVGLFVWLWGWGMLSCYFPFLLSAKYYCRVKPPALRKLLISDRLNRSASSKTRLEDRDKLPAVGAVYYAAGAVLLGLFYVSEGCVIVRETLGTQSAAVHALAALSPCFGVGIGLLSVICFVFYQIDYGLGKLFDPNRGRL